jgi:radical SAM superfamily enzyme YgiQ (UPF0313 family)
MKVALIGPELEENLALEYLDASLRRAGHEPRVFDFHSAGQLARLVQRIRAYNPDVVGLSMVFTGRAREFVALAEELRCVGFRGHITAGGHFASFHARELLTDHPAIDSVIHGEGEEAIVDLIAHLGDLGAVAGISHRDRAGETVRTAPRRNPDDLDSRPFPTRPASFHSYLGMPIANVLSSRGCYANCHFCSINAWYRQNPGKRYRQRDVARVAEEIARLHHERGCRLFNFHDDNFFLPDVERNVERFGALKRRLDAQGVGRIGIQVKARPDDIEIESLRVLREIGLFRVFLGVESNSVAGLRTLGRGITREQNHRALRILRQMRLHVSFNLLAFDPETTLGDLADNIAFIRRYADVPLNFGRTEVYSGTALEQRLRAEGRLIGDYFGYSYRIADPAAQRAFELFHKVFLPRNFDAGALNLAAMRLDYYFHILRHFFPDRADARLHRRARHLIAELNADSAAILERGCAFAASAESTDAAALDRFAAAMARQRAAFDARMSPRMESLVDEIKARAEAGVGRSRVRIPRAAAVAAAALIVTASGCKEETHPTEMAPPPITSRTPTPTKAQTPTPSPTKAKAPSPTPDGTHMAEMAPQPIEPTPAPSVARLADADVEAVKKRIKEVYQPALTAVAQKHKALSPRISLELTLDKTGKVKAHKFLTPAGFDTTEFGVALAANLKTWTFPTVKKDGQCSVTLELAPLPRPEDVITTKLQDIHMFEMMMRPMEREER